MVITTLTGKNQTTLGMEFVKFLGLRPGTRLKQTVVDGGIFLEPMRDIMDSCGIFKKYAKGAPASISEETEAAERGMAEDAMNSMRDE